MKELVSRIFQADFLKGMGVTFRTQFPSNVYTEQYPLERPWWRNATAERPG